MLNEKTAPTGGNPFLPAVLASLEELNRMLPPGQYPELQEEIRSVLTAATQEYDSPDFLAAAIRCKLFALLALTNGNISKP